MATETGRVVIERLFDIINSKQPDLMDEVFADDAIMEWPQSGERVVGAANRRAIYSQMPGLPTVTPRRVLGAGDLWVAEANLDYGEGGVYQVVFVFELRQGRIAKETAYWSKPFEAPAWRKPFVERI